MGVSDYISKKTQFITHSCVPVFGELSILKLSWKLEHARVQEDERIVFFVNISLSSKLLHAFLCYGVEEKTFIHTLSNLVYEYLCVRC